jgi:tRNA (guanine37-N1)-methyltransferase
MVMIDAIARLLPGVLGHDQSAENDSFVSGLLDYPHYTRPEEIAGIPAPKVLLSGDHKAIARWRLKESVGNTWQKRPDLLKRRILSPEEQKLLDEYIAESTRNSP